MRKDGTEHLEKRLRAERPMQEAPHGFTDRVMATLHSVVPSRARHTVSVWPRFALGFAAFAAAAIAASLFVRQTPKAPAADPAVNVASVAPVPAPEPLRIVSQINAVQFQELSLKLDQPLETE